jgi:transposase
LTPFSTAIEELILLEPVVGADKTGLRVNNKLHWLHILCAVGWTWYRVHQKRGQEALDFFGILTEYAATSQRYASRASKYSKD